MRTPWLAVNLATGLLGAYVVSRFEGTIRQFAVLAVFLPVVASMGGNAAAQTLTVMVRGMALGDLSWANAGRALFKELLVGCVNGVAIGSIVALMALVWKGHTILGLVIAISMIGNLLVAALAGTLVPITLMWLKVDPASASSVFVTTVTDACGFLMFLELGELLLGRFS